MPYKNKKDQIAYRKRNGKKRASQTAAWRKRNPEQYKKHKADHLLWQKRNPHIASSYVHKRRALIAKAGGSYTAEEWLSLCESFGKICLRCKKKKALTADHVVPVSKGGSSYIENIQPLCKICNAIKHVKTIDFRTKARRVFLRRSTCSVSTE